VQEHLILGIDELDAEAQRDLWLAQNPSIRVIHVHPVKREPKSLLCWIGGNCVPRVSILVEFDADDFAVADNVSSLRAITQLKTSSGENTADASADLTCEQHPRPIGVR
jgi:hypothetical protein